MFGFVKKLMFARLFSFEEGKITILGQSWVMSPSSIMLQLIRHIKISKNKKMLELLYKVSKETGIEYMETLKKQTKNIDKLIEVGVNSLNLGGWGRVMVRDFDWKNKRGIVHFEDSTMGKLWLKRYGVSKEPVDYIMCGFVSGGLSIITNTDIDGIETKCIAMGSPRCEFVLNPSKSTK